MAQRWRQWSALLAVLLAVFGLQAQAEDKPKEEVKPPPPKVQQPPPPPPDAEFLEFLANWDSEDEDWNQYLAAKPAPREEKKAVDK